MSACRYHITGWSKYVEPVRHESLFCYRMCDECGRPGAGAVTDCMRRIRAKYRYTIRRVTKDESRITSEKFAHALIDSNSQRDEIKKKLRRNKSKNNFSGVLDDRSDDNSVSALFADKFSTLFTSVAYDQSELNGIMERVTESIRYSATMTDGKDYVINADDVRVAVSKLKHGKIDGM